MSANGNLVALLVYKIVALAVGFGFAWMGYQLFLKGITTSAGSAEGRTGAGVTLKLSRVAPGVFFAILGAAIVVYTVTRILQFRDSGGTVSTAPESTTMVAPVPEPRRDSGMTIGHPTSEEPRPATVLCDTCTAPLPH